jgi:SAM-dependent methyltransferase
MSDADRERWDARHAAAGPPSPAPPGALAGAAGLVDAVPVAGRALDVACGRGAVAVWLARRGLTVDAVDVSRTGLAAGARLAAASGVGGSVRWIAHDLDGGLPASCTGPYDVVVCQLFRDPARYADLVGVLAPGGLLAVTVLSQSGAGPGPFRAPPGELRAAFRHLDVLLDREGGGEATLLARAPRHPAVPPRTVPPGSPPGRRPPS